MSEQNRYQISVNYKSSFTEEWAGWGQDVVWETADTWQEAINQWLDFAWAERSYQVASDTPSAGGKSGIIEIQFDPPAIFYVAAKVKATLIEN